MRTGGSVGMDVQRIWIKYNRGDIPHLSIYRIKRCFDGKLSGNFIFKFGFDNTWFNFFLKRDFCFIFGTGKQIKMLNGRLLHQDWGYVWFYSINQNRYHTLLQIVWKSFYFFFLLAYGEIILELTNFVYIYGAEIN